GAPRGPPPNDADRQYPEPQQYPTQLGQLKSPYMAAMRTASSTSTETRRETPGSFMVTPTSCEAISMVLLLWVMKMNCTLRAMSRTMSQKRPTLFSSSGASTSSRRQNGAGFKSKIANTKATAVNAFSPPDNWLMVLLRLPGGRAMTETPAASDSSP